VARHYRRLRDLDGASVQRVVSMICETSYDVIPRRILDVGAGTGRYAEVVARTVGALYGVECHPVAYDASRSMVECGWKETHSACLHRAVGIAERLPFATDTFHAVLCFNAVHHFQLDAFVAEAVRTLRPEGLLSVYTRTPEQNEDTIWGRHFPRFAERETRLHSESELCSAMMRCSHLSSVHTEHRPWTMETSLSRLLAQARGRYYSTFSLYSTAEFEMGLEAFRRSVLTEYPSPSTIRAQNDHVLIAARKAESDP
jgi:SAM-dependent methyltransferase